MHTEASDTIVASPGPARADAAQVSIRGVTKLFRSVRAVDDVSLEVRQGEFLVLVGPSGCGKSTLLRIVAGLEVPDSGEVWIGDRMVNALSPRDRDVAMVFQNYALYPHMTVFDNLAFGLRMRKMPAAEIRSRVEAAAELLGLSQLLKRRPKQLSGGQHQRVALGRAIVRHPQVFLMDEPLSNLDAKLRVQTRAELIKLHRRLGVTTLYVTHDQTEAMTMGERIAVLKDGVLQQVDDPLTVYRRPANRFVAGFIGTPAMNFVPMRLETDGEEMRLVGAGLSLPLPAHHRPALASFAGRAIIFGVRPGDIRPAADGEGGIALPVDVVEPTGETLYAWLLADGVPLVAQLPAETHVQVGAPLRVVFDLTKAHVFDAETEVTLV